MASLTIRNLEDAVKTRLRIQAASRGHSMEEEARHILRAALGKNAPRETGLGERIRERFAPLGDVRLAIAPREPVREPMQAGASSVGTARRTRVSGKARGRRRG